MRCIALPEPRAHQGCSPAAPHLEFALELVAQSGVHLLAVLLHISAQGLQRCQLPSKLLGPGLQVHGRALEWGRAPEWNSLQLLASGTGSAGTPGQVISPAWLGRAGQACKQLVVPFSTSTHICEWRADDGESSVCHGRLTYCCCQQSLSSGPPHRFGPLMHGAGTDPSRHLARPYQSCTAANSLCRSCVVFCYSPCRLTTEAGSVLHKNFTKLPQKCRAAGVYCCSNSLPAHSSWQLINNAVTPPCKHRTRFKHAWLSTHCCSGPVVCHGPRQLMHCQVHAAAHSPVRGCHQASNLQGVSFSLKTAASIRGQRHTAWKGCDCEVQVKAARLDGSVASGLHAATSNTHSPEQQQDKMLVCQQATALRDGPAMFYGAWRSLGSSLRWEDAAVKQEVGCHPSRTHDVKVGAG